MVRLAFGLLKVQFPKLSGSQFTPSVHPCPPPLPFFIVFYLFLSLIKLHYYSNDEENFKIALFYCSAIFGWFQVLIFLNFFREYILPILYHIDSTPKTLLLPF